MKTPRKSDLDTKERTVPKTARSGAPASPVKVVVPSPAAKIKTPIAPPRAAPKTETDSARKAAPAPSVSRAAPAAKKPVDAGAATAAAGAASKPAAAPSLTPGAPAVPAATLTVEALREGVSGLFHRMGEEWMSQTRQVLAEVTRAQNEVAAKVDALVPAARDAVLERVGHQGSRMVRRLEDLAKDSQTAVESHIDKLRDVFDVKRLAEVLKAAAPEPMAAPTLERDLDDMGRALRRQIVTVVERQGERLAAPIASARRGLGRLHEALESSHPHLALQAKAEVERLDGVLEELGVETFDAVAGEAFDPLIHVALGEGPGDQGRVTRMLQAGYRTSGGQVLLAAQVLIGGR